MNDNRVSGGKSVLFRAALGGLLGFAIPALTVLIIVFALQIQMNLGTGIRWVDSMLYSMSGPIAIVILAIIWGVCGAAVGSVLGGLSGAASNWLKED